MAAGPPKTISFLPLPVKEKPLQVETAIFACRRALTTAGTENTEEGY